MSQVTAGGWDSGTVWRARCSARSLYTSVYIRPSVLPSVLPFFLTVLTYLLTYWLRKALVGFTEGQLRAWLRGRGEAGDLFAEP